ncbi:MAG: HlyC/CorC family transporter [Lachnospiraceae bacterium]|nr:HlyC/CorC family transporter [Lachnospiraceae bacterium]
MDTADIIRGVVLVILIAMSAFFSSAETALTTVNKIKLRSLAESGNKRARTVLDITEDSGKMLSAILIGNNLVNISASSIATVMAVNIMGSAGAGVATGVLTFLLLIFGEVTPKTRATIHSEKLALRAGGIISALMTVLTPFIFIVNALSALVLRLTGTDPNAKSDAITEEELITFLDVSQEDGVIEKDEKKMINNVVDFGDAVAKDIMIPREDMCLLPVDSSYQRLLFVFRREHFTRYPIYEDTPDNVIGIINVKDIMLANEPDEFDLRDYIRKPHYTYENKKLSEMLTEMRQSGVNLTIILNEYGSCSGMVTMEDLLEEIVGDIRDEYDEEEQNLIREVGENEYLIEGHVKLDDLNDRFELSLESHAEYDSLGGLVIEHLNKMPAVGDEVRYENVLLRIEKMQRRRISLIRMTILSEKADTVETVQE